MQQSRKRFEGVKRDDLIEYIEDIEAGSSAAHRVLDRYGVPRETSTWSGPVENVTDHPLHERIEMFATQLNVQPAAAPTPDPSQLHTEG